MFPVFESRLVIPGSWPASILSIGLGGDKGIWESRVVREGGFANVITEMKYRLKFGLYLMGALMPILIIAAFFASSDILTALAIIPVYLGLGFLFRIQGLFAHDSAIGEAQKLVRSKA